MLAAPDLVEVALDALCETYDWVLVSAASNDDGAVLAPIARRAQGALVMAGQASNGHAVEAAYRLDEMSDGPVSLVLDAPSGLGMPMPRQRDEEPA